MVFFFFKQKTAYEVRISDWSSDVCSSDLISRTGLLADLPPFQRRLAIFAQAALFERHAYGHVGVEHFTKWAIGQRGRRFYYQTLSELREEPRWVADYCTPDQLKAEFLGRISYAP